MGFVGNYLRNLAAVAVGAQPTRPLIFSYYVTHRCDLACGYCCDGNGKRFNQNPIQELTTADAKRLLGIVRRVCDTLDVTGGEPLLRPDLEEILAYAKELGFRTVLNTKGLGLTERPALMQLADVLVLGIDTLDAERLARIIGRSSALAHGILETLNYATAVKQVTGTRVILSTVAMPGNLAEVERVLAFALDHALGFHVSPEIAGTTPNPALRSSADYRALIDTVLARKRRHKGILGITPYLRGIREFSAFRCHPLLMPVVRPDGKMYYPCLESAQAEVSLLATGDYFAALRQARARQGPIPACRDCCHIFCHMALSLFQRAPFAALRELRHWRN